MKLEDVLKSIKEARSKAKKRNFVQSFDLIISLKEVNLKKPEEQIDMALNLPFGKGKKPKIACFAGKELEVQAKQFCDLVITRDDILKYVGKNREIRKLCNEYDFFIAQVNMMPQVAQVFGKFLSTRGKMPDPKIGLVVPPNVDLKEVVEKL
ncbi:MAG: 50S ribosomal protein L1, partial [Candidatus Nanoarchaeia archaeon]|nr:50S ribosomal protein L1 [Candidatus Jingweiarchaeum tengchongense]